MSVATDSIKASIRAIERLPHNFDMALVRNVANSILRDVEFAEREAGTGAAQAIGQIVAAIMQHPKLATCRVSVERDRDSRCTVFMVRSSLPRPPFGQDSTAQYKVLDSCLEFKDGYKPMISRAVESLSENMGYGPEWGVSPLKASPGEVGYIAAMREQEQHREKLIQSLGVPRELLEQPPAPPAPAGNISRVYRLPRCPKCESFVFVRRQSGGADLWLCDPTKGGCGHGFIADQPATSQAVAMENVKAGTVGMFGWPFLGSPSCCCPEETQPAPSERVIAAAKAAGAKILEHDRKNCPDCAVGLTGWLPCEKHADPVS